LPFLHSPVHQYSDAPALSNAGEAVHLSAVAEKAEPSAATGDNNISSDDAGWDDAAFATTSRSAPAAASVASLSLQDTNSSATGNIKSSYIDPDNIAEKLRVEETKAALAAAREGMEREAQKLKEEKEQKEQQAAEKAASGAATAPRFGAAAGGKWVPPHMRGSTGVSLKNRMSGGKIDVADEELFPDLAAADKIIEQQQEKKKGPKPITATTGATWASKMAAKKKERESAAVAAKPKEEAVVAPQEKPKEEEKPAPTTPEPAPVAAPEAAKPVVKKTLTKKKKKDLSTFKPGA